MPNSKKKILIVGGTGFIGRSLRHYLETHTSYQVLAPTRNDLNLLDDQSCKKYLSNEQPDYVIHCAVDINSVENSLRIFFNIYNQHHSYGQLIQLGSGAEYDKRCYVPLVEESQFGLSVPVDTYGMAKFLIARELKSTHRNSINLRLFGIFGNFEDYSRRFISNNICRSLAGLPVSLNRDMLFDYIHVDDLARMLVNLFGRLPLRSNDYNFCTGRPLSLKFVGSLICNEMQQEHPIQIKQEGLNPEYSGNPNKLFSEIGGFEFTPIEMSIKSLAQYFRENLSKADLEKFKRAMNEQK